MKSFIVYHSLNEPFLHRVTENHEYSHLKHKFCATEDTKDVQGLRHLL